ncbi:hypothetical protein QBC34DRAFT_424595 [Podospora aff. communis PSN243]|uniref:Cyanovirin-N domain-containing protein n=1 Tax=Podospora aff. communis PSN243 TaxID=3040156 RepID=A0AAV9GQC5_9PEZI|nr:hypothetical protein QBC34DRAFT_424595 [Podospora aff. communis PSN243]
MQPPSTTAILLAAIFALTATAIPSPLPIDTSVPLADNLEIRDTDTNGTVGTRAQLTRWSFTPFVGRNTCTGSAGAYSGTQTIKCTNIAGGAAGASIIVLEGCTLNQYLHPACGDVVLRHFSPTSACFPNLVARSFDVTC